MVTSRAQDPVKRFWSKVNTDGECWVWLASRTTTGYGHFNPIGGVSVKAHRYSFMLHYGAISPAMFVCHKCDNPICVRPDHLFLGDAKANALDMARKGRSRAQKLTHCKNGHEFTSENTIPGAGGKHRICRACRNESRRGQRARQRAREQESLFRAPGE